MPRPKIKRCLRFQANVHYFKPAGTPMRDLEEVIIKKDELEALKHYSFDFKNQTETAKAMGISQPTLARTLKKTQAKIADALVNGKAIRLEE